MIALERNTQEAVDMLREIDPYHPDNPDIRIGSVALSVIKGAIQHLVLTGCYDTAWWPQKTKTKCPNCGK